MDKVSACQRLVDIYFELISWEHHKTRDMYFSINLEFCAGQEPKYVLLHEGYCYEFCDKVSVNEDPFVKFAWNILSGVKGAVDLDDNRGRPLDPWGIYGLKELYEAVPEWEQLVKEAEELFDRVYKS